MVLLLLQYLVLMLMGVTHYVLLLVSGWPSERLEYIKHNPISQQPVVRLRLRTRQTQNRQTITRKSDN